MNCVPIAKTAVNLIVGAGVKKIVTAIVDNNVQPEKTLETIEIAAGSYVLSALVASATKKHTDAQIDKAVAWWQAHKDKTLQETTEEVKSQISE